MFCRRYRKNRAAIAGFSLLEMLITSAIIGIITTVVLVRYGAFNSAVLLKNQAFEVALDIRQAQVFSISVRGENNQFRERYGIHFDFDSDSLGTYVMFLDTGTDEGEYDVDDQIIKTAILDSRYQFEEACIVRTNDSRLCLENPGNIGDLSITFQRPNYDAKFVVNNGGSTITDIAEAEIVVGEVLGDVTRTVFVKNTGQITVQ